MFNSGGGNGIIGHETIEIAIVEAGITMEVVADQIMATGVTTIAMGTFGLTLTTILVEAFFITLTIVASHDFHAKYVVNHVTLPKPVGI
jgi:hypothetical protein